MDGVVEFLVALAVFFLALAWIYGRTLDEEEIQAELDEVVARKLRERGE